MSLFPVLCTIIAVSSLSWESTLIVIISSLLIIIIIIIIMNDTFTRSLESVVTECKEHTIHTQTQVVLASTKPKEIKRTHEGEANLTT